MNRRQRHSRERVLDDGQKTKKLHKGHPLTRSREASLCITCAHTSAGGGGATVFATKRAGPGWLVSRGNDADPRFWSSQNSAAAPLSTLFQDFFVTRKPLKGPPHTVPAYWSDLAAISAQLAPDPGTKPDELCLGQLTSTGLGQCSRLLGQPRRGRDRPGLRRLEPVLQLPGGRLGGCW
jgi:hypothetical protein